jgi:hypothetical protein
LVAGQWRAESFATAEEALTRRDQLLDAGFAEVKVDGLPQWFGPADDRGDDLADDDELVIIR